eukprot:2753200-Rhodomonas_salina.2
MRQSIRGAIVLSREQLEEKVSLDLRAEHTPLASTSHRGPNLRSFDQGSRASIQPGGVRAQVLGATSERRAYKQDEMMRGSLSLVIAGKRFDDLPLPKSELRLVFVGRM